jgi:hypothetical protein
MMGGYPEEERVLKIFIAKFIWKNFVSKCEK